MDQAMKKAVEQSRKRIMDIVECFGAQTLDELQEACNSGDITPITLALEELVKQGALIEDYFHNRNTLSYDLPCQPWPDAA